MFVTRSIEDIPVSIKYLIDSISRFEITNLCLNSNAIGVRVVPSFSDFLSTAPHLIHLNLSDCGISALGMELVEDALMLNDATKLKELIIKKNNFGDGGAKALARYFSSYDGLEMLEIAGCRIEEEGMLNLIKSVTPSAKNGSLLHLDFNDNKAGNGETADELCNLIQGATNLQYINISDLSMKDQSLQLRLIDSFANSQSREKLTKIHWNYDVEKTKIAIKAQKVWKRTFEELNEVSMVGSMFSK